MLLNINNKHNISLCGMMGSGKSSIGKLLASKIDYNFIDTDQMIEINTGKTIQKIFKEDGEEYFRDLEEKIIINILKNKKTVVSLGGGAIINNNIRNSIKKNSYNIYLKVNVDILVKRLKNSRNRPLIYKKNIQKELMNLINKREHFYQEADLIIVNENNIFHTTQNIINKILN